MACYGTMFVKDKFDRPVQVPCGQCIGCRLEKARQWAVRCTHEAQMHSENCFITLTYNNENLPEDHNVSKRALQLFFKRLRKRYKGKGIRYYACGEYGDNFGRPHYHACIFGHDFTDKEQLRGCSFRFSKNHFQKGQIHSLFKSEELADIWPYGFNTVGEMSFESAGYVARYTMKKITGEKADDHYQGRTPEFALMSRKPGIGAPWFEKYKNDVYPKDFFTLNGVKNRPPRYYDMLLEKENPYQYFKIKKKRGEQRDETDMKEMMEEIEGKRSIYRKKQQENHRILTTKQLRRGYENDRP